jgi:hypothetical protein
MSNESSSTTSCWDWLYAVAVGYSITASIFAMIMKVEFTALPWWAHLVALLTGVPIYLLVLYLGTSVGDLLVRIFTYLGVPIAGIVLLVFLIRWDLRLWICLIGVAFLVVGFLCAIQANKASKPRKTNTPDFDVFLESPERYAELIRIDEQEARIEAQKAASAWAFNSLGGYLVGVAMIIAGIVTFFINKGS